MKHQAAKYTKSSKKSMKTLPIAIPKDKIVDYCRQWKIIEFALFGSVLRDSFEPTSDIDVLVSFDSEARWTLLDHVQMQDELRRLFGRDVDLVSKRGLENSRNHIRREEILNSAQVIYARSHSKD